MVKNNTRILDANITILILCTVNLDLGLPYSPEINSEIDITCRPTVPKQNEECIC